MCWWWYCCSNCWFLWMVMCGYIVGVFIGGSNVGVWNCWIFNFFCCLLILVELCFRELLFDGRVVLMGGIVYCWGVLFGICCLGRFKCNCCLNFWDMCGIGWRICGGLRCEVVDRKNEVFFELLLINCGIRLLELFWIVLDFFVGVNIF